MASSKSLEIFVQLVPLPALTDNYIWLMHDDEGMAIIVDPGEAAVVEQALAARNLTLKAVLLTHHHPDHIGGMAELRQRHAVPVYAPADERIDEATVRVRDGQRITIASPCLAFDVIEVPGHTRSHVAYVGAGRLFCGDTLFSMGCGRLFEGTAQQMLDSLDRLCALPDDTEVCGGHEYTETNGRFASTVEPHNPQLNGRIKEVAALRSQGKPTLPVALAVERATNPFLRTESAAVAQWCREHGVDSDDRTARFAALRSAKDTFH